MFDGWKSGIRTEKLGCWDGKKKHYMPSFYLFIFGKYQTDSWLKVASEERE
jgi:hypothetical protein